jgi:ferritin-like metal-binding protein YciE
MSHLLHAEKQLVKALPKMAKAAHSEELKEGFQRHLEETKGHVERIWRSLQPPKKWNIRRLPVTGQ